MRTLTIPRPCDFHTHLRSPAQVGEKLFRLIVEKNCAHYRYVVVEPNTFLDAKDKTHHIETAEDVVAYQAAVANAWPDGCSCEPLFLIKLTPHTTPDTIRKAKAAGAIGLKLYPEGVTTGSEHGGVSDFLSPQILECLECAQEEGLVFQIHPEQPGEFCLLREYAFHNVVQEYARLPRLRIFVEHMTDRRTLQLVHQLNGIGLPVYGTITGHHLKLTLDDVLGQVNHHCWPCAKYPEDKDSLVSYAIGAPRYCISITDSAPHEYATKHLCERACAGVFNPAEIAIPWLVSVFDRVDYDYEKGVEPLPPKVRAEKLVRFTSQNGLEAYGLPEDPSDTITLVEEEWKVPATYDTGAGKVTPFLAGQTLRWRIAS